MKNVALTFVALLMAVLPSFAENVTLQTAQRAAQSFINSKMEGNQRIHLIDFAEKAEFPNFYVFGNERCFVIIAADNCVRPVLGYSMEGGFGNGTIPECVSDWLKAYTDGIASVKESRLNATVEIRSEWEMLLNGRGLEPKSRSNVKPLIRTKWNQRDPFNSLCPLDSNGYNGHAAAGCGAIAMAQIMNYWEHPVRGVGSHCYVPATHTEYDTLCASFGETVYDWDNMKNIYSRGYNETEALAVATLVYHCGVSVDMDYDFRYDQNGQNPVSNVSQPILDDALIEYFDYSSNTTYVQKAQFHDTIWVSMLKQDLNDLQPVLYRAASNNQGANAHIFICDGYDENDFFHFNWGHAGNYDGYYTIAELHEGLTNYNYGNYAMFGCRPNTTPINPPDNIHASVNGQAVNVSWSSVNTAACYKLYRDGDLINGHITGVSYTESDVPFGLHTYYVKSVKMDGTMSLKSNTVDIDVSFSGPQPTNLQALVNGREVSLSWQTENPESAILQYGTGNCIGGVGTNTEGTRTSWAQRFPVSMLQEYSGMAIEKVDFYVRTGKYGEYTVGIYKEVEMDEIELVYQQTYYATAAGWQEIVFPSPVTIDYTHDLWVVFSSCVYKPASICFMSNHYDALLYSYDQSGILYWNHRAEDWSWMMKTYLTDGTYTYNLYRNGDAVATNLTDNTYTDSNLPDGIYDYHVTNNYFGGESDPSNVVSVQIGTPVTQTISFTSGWNWWSTYIEQEGIEGLGMLQDGLDGNGISIRSQADGYIDYYAGYGWYGSLSGINNESSYKIKTDASCSVAMTGMGAVPSQHPITLSHGWTWMGYVPSTAMDVNEALSGMNAIQGDMLKSQQGYADYYPNYGWYGSLNTIEPGMGLMYYSSSNQPKTLVYPEGGRGVEQKANHTADNNHWVPDMHAYPHNMTVTAIIELDGEELRAENYELAAFAADECRGSVRLMYVEPIDRWVAFLTVAGEDAANLNFSLFDMETGMEYSGSEETLNYKTDAMVGTMGEPYIVRFRNAASEDEKFSHVSIFPNPANDILTIRGEGIHSVTVFNMTGQSVDKVDAEAVETLILDVNNYETGVYLLFVQSKYGNMRKLFVKK